MRLPAILLGHLGNGRRNARSQAPGCICAPEQMYGPPLCCKRKMKVRCWSAQMYTAFVGEFLLAMMECAALSSFLNSQSCEDFFTPQVSRAPGLTVGPSHYSPADLAGNLKLRSRRWAVDVGIAQRFPSLARRHLQASQAVAGPINTRGRYTSLFASTAQAMRASLLASATTATLGWVRADSCASHAFRPEVCLALCCRTARAPWMNNVRK